MPTDYRDHIHSATQSVDDAIHRYHQYIAANPVHVPKEVLAALHQSWGHDFQRFRSRDMPDDQMPADQLLVFGLEKDEAGMRDYHDSASRTLFDSALYPMYRYEEDRLEPHRTRVRLDAYDVNDLARRAAIILKDVDALRGEFPVASKELNENTLADLEKQPDMPDYVRQAAQAVLAAMRESHLPQVLAENEKRSRKTHGL